MVDEHITQTTTIYNDATELFQAVTTYIEWMRSDDYHEDGLDKYKNNIYEKAVEFIYGKEVWEEIGEIMTQPKLND